MGKVTFLLWIFVCAAGAFGQTATQGSLFASDAKGRELGACPMKSTSVRTDISGFLARVRVTQEFENSFTEPIEAVYVFPLSQNGAVDDMTMTVGTRVIRGKIMRREEARKVYETAKNEGKTAALLDQERENIFTQSVANIMPGEKVTVEISYVETLKYEDGAYEFVFPMTVGPRYIPGSVTDAAKIAPPVAATRAGHDISIEVNLDAGVPVEEIRSTSHAIEQVNFTPALAKVTLRGEKTIPNKDFVLRYDVTGKRIEDAILTHRDGRGGFFTLMLQPPDKFTTEDRTPKEIVFVLDTSGSMSGFPIEKAKEAMKLSLDGLYPEDTFNLITFAGDEHVLFDKPVPATQANLERAQRFLETREGGGGTEMMKAIKAALDPSDSQTHLRIACFMTDAYVGNEDEIVAEIRKHPNARVFSFGIGSSVNRSLLDRMAEAGRGEVEYVSLEDDGSKAAKKFYERVRTPLLTDLSIDWNGLPVADVYPTRLTDLFSAKPVIVSGRYTKVASGTIKLRGKVAGQPYEREIKIDLPETQAANDVLATLWARTRIAELSSDKLRDANPKKVAEFDKQITNLGLEFRLLTNFTSFVAVEDRIVNQNGKPVTIQVPVEAPEGVNLETAVGDKQEVVSVARLNKTGYYSNGTGSGGGGGGGSATATVNVVTRSSSKSRTRAGKGAGRGSGSGGGMGSGSGSGSPPPARMALMTLSPGAISTGVINGKATSLPKPTYPAAARAVNAQGSVSVQVTIDEVGDIISAKPISGHPLLRASAIQAAQKAKFTPTMLSGQPVKVVGVVTYNFNDPAKPTNVTVVTENISVQPSESPIETVVTPEMIRDARLKEKLHTWLYSLVTRLAKGDTRPTANESFFVRDGKAEIRIDLTKRAVEVIEKLKAAGFEMTDDKGKTEIIGRIAIEKLATLGEIAEVRLVLPKI